MTDASATAPSWFGGPANTNPPRSSLEPTWGHSAAYKGSYNSNGGYAKDIKDSDETTAARAEELDAWWAGDYDRPAEGLPARSWTPSKVGDRIPAGDAEYVCTSPGIWTRDETADAVGRARAAVQGARERREQLMRAPDFRAAEREYIEDRVAEEVRRRVDG
jgi:hypothetical protein